MSGCLGTPEKIADYRRRVVSVIHEWGPFILERRYPTKTREDIFDSDAAAVALTTLKPGDMLFDRRRHVLGHGSMVGAVVCVTVPES